jgi:CheY-like chemotaxis protein
LLYCGLINQKKREVVEMAIVTQDRACAMRVLVVDDEVTVADSLVMILKSRGYQATAVYSGECAINQAAKLEPDVLISDVLLPGMTGVEAAGRIMKIAPACRVLLVSGQMMTADLLQDSETPSYEFEILSKPVRPQDLLNYLDKLP